MIPVEILNGRGQCIWDGELHCLPIVGHVLKLNDKTLTVYKVVHRISHVGGRDEHHIDIYTSQQ